MEGTTWAEWRPRRWARTLGRVAGALAVGAAAGVVVRADPEQVVGAALAVATMVGLSVYFFAYARSYIRLESRGVAVRNLRNQVVPWSDVVRCGPARRGVVLVRRAGRVCAMAVQQSPLRTRLGARSRADEVCDAITYYARWAHDHPDG
jgi:hypothetical protein